MSRRSPVATALGYGLSRTAVAIGVPFCLSLGLPGAAGFAAAAERGAPAGDVADLTLRWVSALGAATPNSAADFVAPGDDVGPVLRADPAVAPLAGSRTRLLGRRPNSVDEVDETAEADEALSEAGKVSSRSVVGPSVAGVLNGDDRKVEPDRGWHLAPIFWSGSLASDLGVTGGDIGATSLSRSETLALQANSFLWQPWFARVGGSLSLTQFSVSADSKSSGDSVSLGGRLGLFPQSRFPIEAFIDTTRNTSSTDGRPGAHFNSQSFGLSNTYRAPDESYTAGGNIQHSRFDTGSGPKSSQTTVNASFTPRIATEMPQSLSADGSYSIAKNEAAAATGLELTSLRLRVSHNINLEDYYGLTLTSEATYDDDARSSAAAGVDEIAASRAQARSSFSWQPIEDLPLRLAGSVQVQRFASRFGDAESSIQSVQGQVATSYNLTNQLSVSGGLSATYVTASTANSAGTGGNNNVGGLGANAGVNYSGLPLDLAGFSYTYGAAANTSLSVQSEGDSRQTLGGSFFHGLARPLSLGELGPLSLSVNQSYAVSLQSGETAGTTYTVGTGAGLTWAMPGLQQSALSASMNATDSRSFGENSTSFQSIGGSATGSMVLSTYSSAGLSANFSFTRQGETGTTPTFSGGGVTSNSDWLGFGMAQVNYRNSRFFSVPRLEYSASYNLSARSASTQNANIAAISTDLPVGSSAAGSGLIIDHWLNQFLNYRLGRLSFRLTNNVAISNDGKKSASLFLNVTRDMGGVLNF